MVVSDWCITNLAHGWWVSIESIKVLLALLEEETVPSAVRCDNDQLLCRVIVGRNLNSTPAVPVKVVRVKSCVDARPP